MSRLPLLLLCSLLTGSCVGEIEYGPRRDDGGARGDAGGPGPPGDAGPPGEAPPPPSPGPTPGPTPAPPSDAGRPDAGPPPPPPVDRPPLAPLEARYHDFGEVEDFLLALVDRHPDRVEVDSYGTSARGRDLWVVRVSDRVHDDEGEPEALLNFSIHGDEVITVECALGLLYTLVEGYDSDPRVRDLVDGYVLHVVPVVSPDGFVGRSREVEGVDPNRQWASVENPRRVGIGIIAAAQRYFEAHDFAGTLDFHAYGELVLLPYGGSFERPPDAATLDSVSRRLAAVDGYSPVQISHFFGTVQIGGSVDYYHWAGRGVHLGVELGTDKMPSPSQIPRLREVATEMALRFVEAL